MLVGGLWRGLARNRAITLRGVKSLLTKIFNQAAPEQGTAIDYSDLTDEKLMWRRNRLLYSEQFEIASSWTKINAGTGSLPIVTPNYSLAPDGTMTARRLQLALNGGATTSDISSITQSIPGVGRGRTVSQGIWLKTNDGSTKVLQFRDDFAITVNKLITVTPTWQLFSEENATTANVDINAVRLWLRGAQGTADSADLSVWGAQLVFAPTLGPYQRITDVSTELMAAFPNHALFQDNQGALAVFAPEQPIGLALDMRIPRGPELVAAGKFDSDTGWTKGTGWSIANGRASIDGSNTGSSLLILNGGLAAAVVAQRYYEISFNYQMTSGRLRLNPVVGTSTTLLAAGTQGWFHIIVPANTADGGLAIQAPDAGSVGWIDNVSVREVPGNHAVQATVGDRPVLSGRVNRLINTEDMTTAAWLKQFGGAATAPVVTANYAAAPPDGVATSVSRIQLSLAGATTGSDFTQVAQDGGGTITGQFYNSSVYLRTTDGSSKTIRIVTAGGSSIVCNLTGTWQRFSGASAAVNVSGIGIRIGLVGNAGYSDTVDILATAAQFTTGTETLRYQRVNNATDYDAIGFPKGARFNGTNSWMQIPNFDLSASDKVGLAISFRKESDAAQQIVYEHSGLSTASNAGTFRLQVQNNAAGYAVASTGTQSIQTNSAVAFPAPFTAVLSSVMSIQNPTSVDVRVNGVISSSALSTQGTGNYSSRTGYIGRREGTTVPLNGVIYRIGIRGTLADNVIAMLERWANEPLKPTYLNATPAAAVAPLDRVIILGASLETGAFGGLVNTQSTEIIAAQNRILAMTGKAVTIHQYAVSGQDLNGTVNTSWPKALSEQAALPGNGRTLVIIGSGGNTITGSSRPLSASVLSTAKAQLQTMIDQIEAKGWDWCLFDLSWRNYSAPLNQYDRTQGAWPWITGVTRSINAARKKLWGRNWVYPDGASWGDLYALYRNNVQILADEVHPSDYLLTRNYVIDNVMIPAITGVPVDQRFIRDEAYPLGLTTGTPTVSGTTLTLPSMATHQGTLHLALYAAGSNPSAAEVVAGNGTGYLTKVAAGRNGTTIDKVVQQGVTAPANSTNYVLAAVFVSDARQTSGVVLNNVTSGVATGGGGGSGSTSPVVMLLRQDKIASPRANINQLSVTEDLTTPGLKLANAVRLDGTPSGIGYTQVNGFNQVNAAGQSANLVPGYFQAGELNQSWYVDLGTANVNLTGFTAGQSYQIMFAASRDVPSTDATRTGDVTITSGTVAGAATQTLNAANPASGLTAGNVTFTVTAPANGVIGFQFKRTAGNSGFGYIGGIHITPVA